MKDQPLSAGEFEALMAKFSPFEQAPLIAVGVSGGQDSMALVYLLDRWAQDRGGRVIGLTLDHGLRPEAADEASQVGQWLDLLEIEHHTLRWIGEKPKTAIQSTARTIRRNALMSWCEDAGVVHLALAHHADDQAETYIMRLTHGSGPDGLAGMASVVEAHHARILRPLLSIPKTRLTATLTLNGQPWINDPSNEQDSFERIRIRKTLTAMTESGASYAAINRVVDDYAEQRHERDELSATIVMRSTIFHEAGYAQVNIHELSNNGARTGERALSRILCAIGGLEYAPARTSVTRLFANLTANGGSKPVTLGGCLFIPNVKGYLICREQRNLPKKLSVTGDEQFTWDNRFHLEIHIGEAVVDVGSTSIRPLGKEGWAELVAQAPHIRPCTLPVAVRYSLPTLYHNDAIIQVAHVTDPNPGPHAWDIKFTKAQFMPPEPIIGGCFPLA